jgi:hypothetical protein
MMRTHLKEKFVLRYAGARKVLLEYQDVDRRPDAMRVRDAEYKHLLLVEVEVETTRQVFKRCLDPVKMAQAKHIGKTPFLKKKREVTTSVISAELLSHLLAPRVTSDNTDAKVVSARLSNMAALTNRLGLDKNLSLRGLDVVGNTQQIAELWCLAQRERRARAGFVSLLS